MEILSPFDIISLSFSQDTVNSNHHRHFSGRGVAWTLKNKRPERLKDSLTEVEV